MKEPKDKRTKEYKQWKKRQQGLGDTIEAITEATGIKKVVEKLFGDDCGCKERKELLNNLKPYDCFNEDEFNWFNEYYNSRHNDTRYSKEDVTKLLKIHQRIFRKHTRICFNCGSAKKSMKIIYNDLLKIYETY